MLVRLQDSGFRVEDFGAYTRTIQAMRMTTSLLRVRRQDATNREKEVHNLDPHTLNGFSDSGFLGVSHLGFRVGFGVFYRVSF